MKLFLLTLLAILGLAGGTFLILNYAKSASDDRNSGSYQAEEEPGSTGAIVGKIDPAAYKKLQESLAPAICAEIVSGKSDRMTASLNRYKLPETIYGIPDVQTTRIQGCVADTKNGRAAIGIELDNREILVVSSSADLESHYVDSFQLGASTTLGQGVSLFNQGSNPRQSTPGSTSLASLVDKAARP